MQMERAVSAERSPNDIDPSREIAGDETTAPQTPQFGVWKSIAFSLILISAVLGLAELGVRSWAYYLREDTERYDPATETFVLIPGVHRSSGRDRHGQLPGVRRQGARSRSSRPLANRRGGGLLHVRRWGRQEHLPGDAGRAAGETRGRGPELRSRQRRHLRLEFGVGPASAHQQGAPARSRRRHDLRRVERSDEVQSTRAGRVGSSGGGGAADRRPLARQGAAQAALLLHPPDAIATANRTELHPAFSMAFSPRSSSAIC